MSVYVGNVSYKVTRDDLMDVFVEYGEVDRINLPVDNQTGRPRGFAFVEMASKEDEKNAIELLDGAKWIGRTLRVNEAEPRRRSSRSSGGR